jgi:tetratricopeptide (TPR) repeat protein
VKVIILFGFICLAAISPLDNFAQCSKSPGEWDARISSIENSNQPPEVKLLQWQELHRNYQKCVSRKDSLYGRIIHRLGDLHRVLGNYESGLRFTKEAVVVNKAGNVYNSKPFLAHSYYNLGLYNYLLGFQGESHLYYDSCISIGLMFKAKTFIALKAFEQKSFMLFQTGDYGESIVLARRGLEVAESMNDEEYIALLSIQLAQSQSELLLIPEAESHISDAVSILKEHHMEEYLANAYSVYGNILGKKKQFSQATDYYEQAFDLNSKYGNVVQSARDLLDLAYLYDKDLHDPSTSIQLYTRALAIAREYKLPYMLATTYNNIGQVYWRKQRFDKALNAYQQGLIALSIGFSENDPRQNPSPQQLELVTNDYLAAALLWNKGDCSLGSFYINHDTSYLTMAMRCYRLGDKMVDQMRWKQVGEQSKLFWRGRTKDWYAKAIEASFHLGNPAQAFYFMEKSRAVILNDKLAELGAKSLLPPEEIQTERSLRISLNSLTQRSTSVNDVWKAQEQLNKFIQELEKKYPAYYAYKYDTTVLTLSGLRESLDENQTWIELFTTTDSIYALVAQRNNIRLAQLSYPGHRKDGIRLTQLCSSRAIINAGFYDYTRLAYSYYAKLFKELKVATPRVTISQDEYFVPYELLKKDTAEGARPLLYDFAFSYAYSASIFFQSDQAGSETNELLGVAPVRYESRLALRSLEGADQSLERISHQFSSGKFLTGKHATKQEFLSQLPEHSLIHIYSHAYGDSTETEPKIFFYDSALAVSDLTEVNDVRTRMIVLLACNTGVGKNARGEGTLSLARGFAAAGIPSTISALWEIDNHATYQLAESFYKQLANGLPSDIALQNAKLELIDQNDKHFELPYFWAGSVLVGRPDVFIVETTSYRKPVMLSLSFLLFILVIYLMKRRKLATQ